MTSSREQKLDKIFGALSDATRRKILDMVSKREHTVSELSAPFEMSRIAVMKHLKVLESAGLIQQEKTGRVKLCSLEPSGVKKAHSWLGRYEKYWNIQLDALDRYIERLNQE